MTTPLKSLRTKLGISQQDLAAGCDVSQAHISDIENGSERASPALAERIVGFLRAHIGRLPKSNLMRGVALSEIHILYPNRELVIPERDSSSRSGRSVNHKQQAGIG